MHKRSGLKNLYIYKICKQIIVVHLSGKRKKKREEKKKEKGKGHSPGKKRVKGHSPDRLEVYSSSAVFRSFLWM